MRDLIVFSGSSHPLLVDKICANLSLTPGKVELNKFKNGETSVTIKDSVREKDVYIVQSGSGHVNDNFIELLIMISACKTASAKRVTAVLPLFPYSRQPDVPYTKTGAPLTSKPKSEYTFESVPGTPRPFSSSRFGIIGMGNEFSSSLSSNNYSMLREPSIENKNLKFLSNGNVNELPSPPIFHLGAPALTSFKTSNSNSNGNNNNNNNGNSNNNNNNNNNNSVGGYFNSYNNKTMVLPTNPSSIFSSTLSYKENNTGYKEWVAQAGTLIADLLTVAGADHIITMDLHDPQFQGFFDVPVDNLYSKPLLSKYIISTIPNYQDCVLISPDAGGAKRTTAIADALGMNFALIHKERRTLVNISVNSNANASANANAGSNSNSNSNANVNNNSAGNNNNNSINSGNINSINNAISGINSGGSNINMSNNAQISASSTPLMNGIGGISQSPRIPPSTPLLNSYTFSNNMNNQLTQSQPVLVATTMLVGDVKDKVCIILDDLVDTSYTITRASKLLKDQGAKYVIAIVTHGIFSGDAINRIKKSAIDKIIVTNSVPQEDHWKRLGPDLCEVLDVSRIFAEAIRRIHNGESVSMLFDHGW
ncbi:ribose phosphate diphosphokinase subunit PRS5 [Ascoidea rubescens DSM 1968]|uniref:ribose-phosphate diphosphokinase n=1 Tax=Ascoidea rubescens DSM 1968 TaxID=1344418 RepID=A0A1D2VM32_9ASCO|nr:phosphoribosyl pyrophosphokinase [Ascoidea rubescens DSM 1968]ODV62659.1 phosphoribosyl pyrophosphokinase [Ascoidea rubescens DSM 1968]